MASEAQDSAAAAAAIAPPPSGGDGVAAGSCWKKRAADAGFLASVKDNLDEFVSTSMDQHRICLKNTMRDFREFVRLKREAAFSSRVDGGEIDSGAKEVAGSAPPPVQATTAH